MPNQFFWYDVMTSDPAAAKRFYRDVVGWGVQEAGAGSPDYTVFTVNDRGVAGLMAIPPEARSSGARPAWMGYVHVDDVDAVAAQVTGEGGKLHRGPVDVAGIIRFAVVSDPQGAGFIVATPMPREAAAPPAAGTPGTVGWHELYATDWKSAFEFYEKLFGWTRAEAHDMGPMGTYQLFAAGEAPIGGMLTRPAQVPAPHWSYYINVASIEEAAARITGGGGLILNGPMQVPGGQWIVQAMDPQGASFALVAPER